MKYILFEIIIFGTHESEGEFVCKIVDEREFKSLQFVTRKKNY